MKSQINQENGKNMKKVSPGSRTGLFLAELTVVILFFAISAAVCMKLFAYAYITTERASTVGHAISAAQNTAECFKASEGDILQTARLLGAAAQNNRLSYQPDGNINLTLDADPDTNSASVSGKIKVTDINNKLLFELDIIALRGIGADVP